jgi:8-oxo-dGTP diphosphatase
MIIIVTCAIIEKEDRVLAVKRSEHMSLSHKWEFPGGKLEPNETPEHCLMREINEELNLKIEILRSLPFNDHNYTAAKTIRLTPFVCKISDGELILREHSDFGWFLKTELPNLDWAEADIPILNYYLSNQ